MAVTDGLTDRQRNRAYNEDKGCKIAQKHIQFKKEHVATQVQASKASCIRSQHQPPNHRHCTKVEETRHRRAAIGGQLPQPRSYVTFNSVYGRPD